MPTANKKLRDQARYLIGFAEIMISRSLRGWMMRRRWTTPPGILTWALRVRSTPSRRTSVMASRREMRACFETMIFSRRAPTMRGASALACLQARRTTPSALTTYELCHARPSRMRARDIRRPVRVICRSPPSSQPPGLLGFFYRWLRPVFL